MSNRLYEISKFYRNKPVAFAKNLVLTKNQSLSFDQERVLNDLCTYKKCFVKSGHGTGKSADSSIAILWFLFSFPGCLIPCTAPTGHQLQDVLWAELSRWYHQSMLSKLDFFEWSKSKFSVKHEMLKEIWTAIPRSCSVPENLAGFHAKNILFIIDEGSGVSDEVMEVIEGALSTDNCYLLVLGNPTRTSGFFYDAFHKHKELYRLLTLSSRNSPFCTEKYIKSIEDKYGKDSDQVRMRIDGEFALQSSFSFVNYEKLIKATHRIINEISFVINIGQDVARFGEDSSVSYHRSGYKVLGYNEIKKQDTHVVSNAVSTLIVKFRKVDSRYIFFIKVDGTGIGGGVVDNLNNKFLQNVNVFEILNNSVAFNDKKYANAATEMYFIVADLIEADLLEIPFDEELFFELTDRRFYYDKDGRYIIESKDDFKKRNKFSPDKADAFCLCFYEPQNYHTTTGATA